MMPAAPGAQAQETDYLSLLDIRRVGDSLEVTMRANVAVHHVTVRLLENGAVAALPDWERQTWALHERATWSFGLLRDLEKATLRWQATEWGGQTQTRTLDIIVPERSFVEPLTLMGVSRSQNVLTVSMRANEDLRESTVRLMSGGAIAGLPEWQRVNWTAGERAEWQYELLRDVQTATLAWEVRPSAGVARAGSADIQIPAPREVATEGAPRLVVTGAALRGTSAVVNVSNYGDGEARNVVVALEDAQQKRIAAPLTRVVGVLPPGAQATLEFALPEDLVDVVVALDQGNQTVRTLVTLRQLGASSNGTSDVLNVTLTTDLPFREVDLGRSADYAVQVRNGGAPSLVQLRVEGLPQGYSARFFVGGSAVPSLYLDRNQTRQATLSVTVPSSRDEVDRTVDFEVIASVNGTEAERLAMGIAVRGVGQLEVSSSDGEALIPAGGQATFQVTIRNSGSAPLFNVELDSRRPYGWTVRVEPRRIDRIEPGASAAVSVEVRSPDVIGDGRYSVDVAARSGETTSRYVSLALNVDEPEQGGGWVWGLLLVLILGILGFAGWWKWRG